MKRCHILLFVIALACDRGEQHAMRAPITPPPSRPRQAAQTSVSAAFAVTAADGHSLLEITQQGSDVIVSFVADGTRQSLRGQVRDNGKRKYSGSDGAVVIEVKSSDDGFKIRTAAGKLLWKIEKTPEKVKISDNEENRNPYELKVEDERIKVYAPAEHFLGEVKFHGDKQRIEVKDAGNHEVCRGAAMNVELFYGVALLDRVPPRERAVIMAELAVPLR